MRTGCGRNNGEDRIHDISVTYLVYCTRSPSQGGGEGEAVFLSRSHLELSDLLRPDTKTAIININTHAVIL